MNDGASTDHPISTHPPASRFVVWCGVLALFMTFLSIGFRSESKFVAIAVPFGFVFAADILKRILPRPPRKKTMRTSIKATPLKVLILLLVFGAVIALAVCYTDLGNRFLAVLGQIFISPPFLFLTWLAAVIEEWRVQYKGKSLTASV